MKQLPETLNWGDALLGIAVTAYLAARHLLSRPAGRLVFNTDPENQAVISVQSRKVRRWRARLFGARAPLEDFGIIVTIEALDQRPFDGLLESINDFRDAVSNRGFGSYATVSHSRPVVFWCPIPDAAGTYKVSFRARWSQGDSQRTCTLTVGISPDGNQFRRPLTWSADTLDL